MPPMPPMPPGPKSDAHIASEVLDCLKQYFCKLLIFLRNIAISLIPSISIPYADDPPDPIPYPDPPDPIPYPDPPDPPDPIPYPDPPDPIPYPSDPVPYPPKFSVVWSKSSNFPAFIALTTSMYSSILT